MSNSLPSLLLQGSSSSFDSCRTDQNPISSLSKNLRDDHSNRFDRFQSSCDPKAFESIEPHHHQHPHPQNPSTTHLINLHLHQERPQLPLDHLSQTFDRLQLNPPPPPPPLSQQQQRHHHNWSTDFLDSVPIHHLLPSNHHPLLSNPNQWQSEFLSSQPLQPDHPLAQKLPNPSLVHHQPILKSSLIPHRSSLHYHHHHPSITHHPVPETHPAHRLNASENQSDWDAAYLRHDPGVPSSTTGLTSLETHQAHDQAPHEYLARSHSPISSSSPDALARTAASLITTVENGQQPQKSNGLVAHSIDHRSSVIDIDPTTTQKFNQSSFMDFMRKLRDGEVKVEGDKVVQQLDPISRSTPSIDHQTRAHQSIDSNIQQPSGFKPMSDSQSFLASQDSTRVDHQPTESSENSVPAEDTLYRAQMNRFQGDGGAISELEDILNAASEVDRPEKQSWTNTSVPGATEAWVEEFDQAQAGTSSSLDSKEQQQPEFDEMGMVGRPLTQAEVQLERLKRMQRLPSAQQLEWEALQHDWEQNFSQDQQAKIVVPETISPAVYLERMETLEAETGYQFQQANPLIFRSDRTKHHSIHEARQDLIVDELQSGSPESILQKEQEVLNDPDSASAWYSLGVKQQENEREDLAIQALRQAIKLDPELSDAMLALSISYSNENRRAEALVEIERWIQAEISKVPHYRRVLSPTNHPTSSATQTQELLGDPETLKLRHVRLTNQLLELARLGGRVPDAASVDPDVQIALGVLFNSNDEFQKACDCFGTALAVRPHDPLLFNRLGATLANSGKPEEAIEYYHKAIELLPTYIRARYNLSISLINLGKYSESVKNILAALVIQEHEANISLGLASHGTPQIDHGTSGVTSAVLWQTLEVNCSLLRNRFSSETRKALDDCFSKKDLKSTHKILSDYMDFRE